MSQPQVLKHSHAPFVNKSEPDLVDLSSSDFGSENTKAHTSKDGQQHVNALAEEPSNSAADEQDDDATSSDGSISGSALEEELDRAEFEPFVDEDGSLQHEAFTVEEAKDLRELLRKIGPNRFVEQIFTREEVPVRKMVTIFGIHPNLPYSEAWYCRALGLAIQRELKKRYKLPQYNTIDDAVFLLQSSKNIMVITGAGISTSLGIPDFRSRNTGFYSQLIERGFDSPEDVFDIRNFDDDPTHFYTLAKEILPVTDRCSPTHAFIKLLQDKDVLLTNFTQNIDNIEAYAGISDDRLIQCHGSWAKASCRKCQHTVPGEEIFEDVRAQRVSKCKRCLEALTVKPRKRKRASNGGSRSRRSSHSDSEDDGQYDIPEAGVLKPNITFFGEQLPTRFFDRLTEHDAKVVDLIIIIGTSMKVAPVSEIPNFVSADVPQIYISREPVSHINFDITLLGYCDVVVAELCRRAGWDLEHPMVPKESVVEVKAYERPGTWFVGA